MDIGAVVGVVRPAGRVVDTARLLGRGEALELELAVDCLAAAALPAGAFSPDCWPSARAIIAADRVLI